MGGDVPQGGRLSINVIDKEGDEVPLNMRIETIPSLRWRRRRHRIMAGMQCLNIEISPDR